MSRGLTVLSVGRTRRGPLCSLQADYLERIARFLPVKCEAVEASRRSTADERRREEASRLIARCPARGVLIALDVRGRAGSSPDLTRWLAAWRQRGDPSFVVGGPDGLAEEFLARADERLSLGPLTLPHELALVVLLEQLYRALADDSGHPYARH